MHDLNEISDLPMSTTIMKQAISSAIRKIIKTERETSVDFDSNVDVFVASNEIEPYLNPPITVDDVTGNNVDEIERIEFHHLAKQLITIQKTLVSNLRTIIGGARSGYHTSDVEVIAETPDHYILHDRQEVIAESLQEVCKVTHTTLTAHVITVNKILDSLQIDHPEGTAPCWIIMKPPHWYDGQWAVVQTIQHLIQSGLSPTETLDYWMCSIMDVPVPYWSHIRDKSESSQYRRISTAKEKLEGQPPQETSPEYEYFTRTYESKTVDGKEFITVDNGFLHSQRNVSNPSLRGNMISGYSGAGPKQLATAILADAFDRDTAIKFNQKLNGQVHKIADENDDGGWTLSEDQLLSWILTNTN